MPPVLSSVAAARAVLTLAPGVGFAPGFTERAEAAALPALPAVRTIRTPAYLTDLGIRAFKDPQRFFELNIALIGAQVGSAITDRQDTPAAVTGWVRHWLDEGAREPAFCAQVDANISLRGDWQGSLALIDEVMASGHIFRTASAQLYVGTGLCALGDARGLALYREVAGSREPATSHMGRIRLAAAQLKRFGQPAEATQTLDEAARECARWLAERRISEGDFAVLRAVELNLRALLLLRSGLGAEAARCIAEAREAEAATGLVTVDEDAAQRYRAQIRVNRAQLLWKSAGPAAALEAISDHVAMTRTAHPYSLSEALTIAGRLNYAADRLPESVTFLEEAAAMLRMEATPVRLELCRKILIGSLHRLGRLSERDQVLEAANSDPLGLQSPAQPQPVAP